MSYSEAWSWHLVKCLKVFEEQLYNFMEIQTSYILPFFFHFGIKFYLFPKGITEDWLHQWWQEEVHFSLASPAPYGVYQEPGESGVRQ